MVVERLVAGLSDQRIALGALQVGRYHLLDQFVEPRGRLPAELSLGLRRVAQQRLHLGRPKIARIHRDHRGTGSSIDSDLLGAVSLPPLLERERVPPGRSEYLPHFFRRPEDVPAISDFGGDYVARYTTWTAEQIFGLSG